ncbi:MAG: hypothetical protein ACLT9P_03165 [Evtepia gabavorous]
MITFEEIKKDPGIRTYIQKADESLINLGFTEHSFAHVGLVAANSKYIWRRWGTPRGRWSWSKSRPTSTTLATWSTASTILRAGR